MKKLLCLFLALLLTGCSLTAAPAAKPAVPSQPTESSPLGSMPLSDETADPSETAISVSSVDFSADPKLSHLPLPPSHIQWYTNDATVYPNSEIYMRVFSSDVSKEDYYNYVEQLKQAGFIHNVKETIVYDPATNEVPSPAFYGENEEGVLVFFHWTDVRPEYHPNEDSSQPGVGGPYGEMLMGGWLIVFEPEAESNIPSGAMPNKDPWDSHSSRALLPPPPTEYWKGREGNGSYIVGMQYLTFLQAQEYAKQLEAAGFCHRISVKQIYGFTYTFIAENQEGLRVRVEYNPNNPSGKGVYLYFSTDLLQGRWDDVMFSLAFLPDLTPYTTLWRYETVSGTGHIIYGYGMDFDSTLAYLDDVESYAVKRGWGFECVEGPYIDREKGLISAYIKVTGQYENGDRFLMRVLLQYDASNSQCPLRIAY